MNLETIQNLQMAVHHMSSMRFLPFFSEFLPLTILHLFQILDQGVRGPRHRGHPQHGGGRPHRQVQLGQGERRPQQHPHQRPGGHAGNQLQHMRHIAFKS